ncbi:FAD-dependent oxidoreductase [Nocardioides alcanivorans]|uniref:FAD-dependent oxidoreductase n=1 Tax=Nocardioides alcanivorans TaxID=2897352 RepID=UPI001F42BCB7|nr:FAD-dependent oxidoreductase [Nocardioides alcanivorans]
MRPIRVAVVGAGPAGIYAADILTKEYDAAEVDVLDRLPAPYGLVRYGVAPDHPRIKEIIKALGRVLANPRIRFLGNVEFGTDLKLTDLQHHYDAVIVATGAATDRPLDIPGIDLPGSHGAADFVSWYAGHPDVPRDWTLDAESVAVIGAGNVGLDVARMLAKPADEQLTTEIADNVHRGLAANRAKDVHVFARRGPAQVKFSPMELRELSHSPSVDVLVEEDGFQIDEASQSVISSNKGVRLVVDTLLKYLEATPTGAAHRIHLHLCHAPVALLGEGRVEAIRTERTQLDGTGNAVGTGSTSRPRSKPSTGRWATSRRTCPTCPSTTPQVWSRTMPAGCSTSTGWRSPACMPPDG